MSPPTATEQVEQHPAQTPPLPAGHYVICDGPPGPESGRFIELEDQDGRGVGSGTSGADWHQVDGRWALGPFKPTAVIDVDHGVPICHDSEVHVRDGSTSGDMPHTVAVDGTLVRQFSDLADAEHLAADIERRIKHAQLVHGIREMADFIEQRPALHLQRASASVNFFGDRDKSCALLAAVAEQLGEYHAEADDKGHATVQRPFGENVEIRAFAYGVATAKPVVAPTHELPDLPGRNLASETPAS